MRAAPNCRTGRARPSARLGSVGSEPWYGVRCIFRSDDDTFEERITVWLADGFDHAIAQAEEEGRQYAKNVDVEYLGFAQAHRMATPALASGTEVFSLIR